MFANDSAFDSKSAVCSAIRTAAYKRNITKGRGLLTVYLCQVTCLLLHSVANPSRVVIDLCPDLVIGDGVLELPFFEIELREGKVSSDLAWIVVYSWLQAYLKRLLKMSTGSTYVTRNHKMSHWPEHVLVSDGNGSTNDDKQ